MFLADVATGKIGRRLVETGERPALRQPAVPELGRRLGARQSALRVRRAQRGPAGADDRRCGQRPPRGRARVRRPRRDLQPGMVARRRAASRSRRSRAACSTCICSISRAKHAAAAHQRCVRRSRSGVVARRPRAGVGDRSLLVRISSTLSFGNYRIGGHGRRHAAGLAQLAGFETGRNTNPEFAADGRAVLHRHARRHPQHLSPAEIRQRGGSAARITNVLSGVSGITPLTPALSAAAAAPTRSSSRCSRTIATTSMRPTRRVPPRLAPWRRRMSAAVLPPANRRPDTVAQLLESARPGCRRRSPMKCRTTRPA